MQVFRQRKWSPYAVGALIGLLSWFAFVSADKPLGVSTTMVRAVGFAETTIAAGHVNENAYFTKTKLKVDWQMMLVVGIFVGALSSALLSGDRSVERVPPLWRERFGSSLALRYSLAFLGGAILLFGARLAGGCTSGHGIFGISNLERASVESTLAFMAAGIVTTNLVYRVWGAS